MAGNEGAEFAASSGISDSLEKDKRVPERAASRFPQLDGNFVLCAATARIAQSEIPLNDPAGTTTTANLSASESNPQNIKSNAGSLPRNRLLSFVNSNLTVQRLESITTNQQHHYNRSQAWSPAEVTLSKAYSGLHKHGPVPRLKPARAPQRILLPAFDVVSSLAFALDGPHDIKDRYQDARSRLVSFASVSPFPEHSSNSGSAELYSSMSSAQVSPTQPTSEQNTLERARVSRRISNAIEGLEDMVQEAAVIAEGTSDRAQVEEIYDIIEDARNAIRNASTTDPRSLMETSSPLQVSEDSYSSDSSCSSKGDSIITARSKLSAQSELLPRPQGAHTEPQENVKHVLRPRPTRHQLLGRSHRPEDTKISNTWQHHHHHRPHTFSLHRRRQRQPIARNWGTAKKRITATIACMNTALLGVIVGIYAGEVPCIQYTLADERHYTILGNVVLYSGLAISTFIFWPLPLLHGRKPYTIGSLALALPLQFPQAIVISMKRSPNASSLRFGLLMSRATTGLVLGFANINFITVLLDLFGASLQSKNPHQEIVVVNDVRRHGGGMGIWLGIWSWCWIGSLAVGFQSGAGIIEHLTPDWGFYVVIIILAIALVLNVLAPETRRAMHRQSVTEVYDQDENFITRQVRRGEIKLHLSTEGPIFWFQEVWAGIKLTVMMCCQWGFLVLALYLGWIYTQIVLVIILLGALLSRDYRWHAQYVGLGVMSIALGALFAVPLTKAGMFSRERKRPYRSDSVTFETQVHWSSHLVRRTIFTTVLPIIGAVYTIFSAGRPQHYAIPITFAGAIGFLSVLAIAECHGLIMEAFDTCDLQPGVNTRHRLQSMAEEDRRRRTNYSAFPRITAGIFASQTLAFVGAAIATEVGGIMTRHLGAQISTGVTAGILGALTLFLSAVLWRFKKVQVIPSHTFGTRRNTRQWEDFKKIDKADWRAVVIGNPSGKFRRMSLLELGSLSRWTEIRKLNYLIREDRRNQMGP